MGLRKRFRKLAGLLNETHYDRWKTATPPEWDEEEECPHCEGEGTVWTLDPKVGHEVEVNCPECKGTGQPPEMKPEPSIFLSPEDAERILDIEDELGNRNTLGEPKF